jgi:hypothetical protein
VFIERLRKPSSIGNGTLNEEARVSVHLDCISITEDITPIYSRANLKVGGAIMRAL